jgi:hypothetical protein
MRTQSEIKELFQKSPQDLTEEERGFVIEARHKALERAKEYKRQETERFVPENKLTSDRESDLRAHVVECEMPYFSCDDCYELYQNVGYQAYVAILVAAGPTESERVL